MAMQAVITTVDTLDTAQQLAALLVERKLGDGERSAEASFDLGAPDLHLAVDRRPNP